MSGGSDVPDDLRAILDAQSNWKPFPTPGFAKLAVLPPIGIAPKTASTSTPTLLKSVSAGSATRSRPATTSSRPPTTSLSFSVLPKIKSVVVLPSESKSLPSEIPTSLNLPESRLVTPLYPIPRSNIAYNINLNDIDENEVLRPSSVSSTILDHIDDDDFDKFIVRLPETFSEFREIGVELDQISFDCIDRMLQNCREIDENQSGFLSLNSVMTAIKGALDLEESSNAASWQKFLELLAEPEQLFDYNVLFQTLKDDKQSREAIIHISEVLDSDDNGSIFTQLPSRPTSSQAQRERGRAQLLIDLEVVLDKNPEIDLKRFKTATDKKMIEVDEFRVLFQIYGLSDYLSLMEQRIIDCFTTHDKLFCFSAFVGCLDQMSPTFLRKFKSSSSHSAKPDIEDQALWMKPPLPKIGQPNNKANFDDSGVVLDSSFSSSHHEHLDFDEKDAEAVSDADFVLQLQNPAAKKI